MSPVEPFGARRRVHVYRDDGVGVYMTDDERIQAEVARILALPDDQQLAEIVTMIDALPPDRRKPVIAYMRDSKNGVTPRASEIANRVRG